MASGSEKWKYVNAARTLAKGGSPAGRRVSKRLERVVNPSKKKARKVVGAPRKAKAIREVPF